MRRSTWLLGVGMALAVVASQAAFAEATPPASPQAQMKTQPNSQQEQMKTCNADAKAKALKGDERKAFMKECLSHHEPETAGTNAQQEKMKSCNADAKAKALKGAERKAFMKSCLSGSAPK